MYINVGSPYKKKHKEFKKDISLKVITRIETSK